MILLLGGTSDTAPIAQALAEAGHDVLVSTATQNALFVGGHPRIQCRRGPLSAEMMLALLKTSGARALVDATHPYATQVRALAPKVAGTVGIPYVSYVRPGGHFEASDVLLATDHEEAARIAFSFGKPVFLTVGSRNIAAYAKESRRSGNGLVARVLDHPDSHAACREAGVPPECVLTGRGPFSVEENRAVLRKHGAGVLVTKDSGDAGGVPSKLEAARQENCRVVVVGRPAVSAGSCSTVQEVIARVQEAFVTPRQVCDSLLAIDLESVLGPEIWHRIADETGIEALRLSTRDMADLDGLFLSRIGICQEHRISAARLRSIASAIEPSDGAREFLAWASERLAVVILTDQFSALCEPLVEKLGGTLAICNEWKIGPDGLLSGFQLRPGGKAGTVRVLREAGFRVFVVGDSFNDLEMAAEASAAFFLRPSPHLPDEARRFSAVQNFDELKTRISEYL